MNNPIYFGISVWGRSFCESFVSYALASLLSEGNIPALNKNAGKNCFLIYTTSKDKAWFETQPLIKLLASYMRVEFLEMTPISDVEYKKLNNSLYSSKLYTMTLGHREILNRMYKDKAVGSIVLADSIYASHALTSAFKYIINGKTAVMVFCPRFANETIVNELADKKYLQANNPINIPARELVKIALNHLHIDMLMQQWNAPYLPEFMLEAGWVLPDKTGMVFHTWTCWCAFINYALLPSHNIESLGNNTIDGVYFGANLKKEETHFIVDSDEFTLISFSPHIDRVVKPVDMHNYLPNKEILDMLKISYAKNFLKGSVRTHTDLFKQQFVTQPIFMHTQDLTPACYALTKETKEVINKILNDKIDSKNKMIFKANEYYYQTAISIKLKIIYTYIQTIINQKLQSIYKNILNKIKVMFGYTWRLVSASYKLPRKTLRRLVITFMSALSYIRKLNKFIQEVACYLFACLILTFYKLLSLFKSKSKYESKDEDFFPIPKTYIYKQ